MPEDSKTAIDDLASLGADLSIKYEDGTPLWFYASVRDEKVADNIRLIAGDSIAAICNPLRRLGIRATCISLCTSIVEKACAYIIHGDVPPCPVTVVIDENGVHHIVHVPCPM